MKRLLNNLPLKETVAIGLLFAILLPYFLAPAPAQAQSGGVSCTISTVAAALGYGVGIVKGIGYIASTIAARASAMFTNVPINDPPAAGTEPVLLGGPDTTDHPDTQAKSEGSVWGDIFNNFKDTCLKALAHDIASIILRQMRNMIITWINTGNVSKPTYVTNFQFDALQAARNAARIFVSRATGYNFCNYFPTNPAYDLNFGLDFRLGVECSVNKSAAEVAMMLNAPQNLTAYDRILLKLPSSDPTWVALTLEEKMYAQITDAETARRTQVTSGKGFVGQEVCVKERVVVPPRYTNIGTGEPCSPGEEGCVLQPALTACEQTKVKTPGSYVADLAPEAVKSELRRVELVDEFEEAVTAIVDTLMMKIISKGLDAVGL